MTTDVAIEADVQALVAATTARWGRIDLFCSNAGIAIDGDESVSNADWQRIWQINVMAHVYAARAVIPRMLERGDGYILNTASAAGLLSQIGSAPYAVTKHAALAFAEWLSITYGDRGLKVSCLCPQGVRTGMLNENSGPAFLLHGMIEPEKVADFEMVMGKVKEALAKSEKPERKAQAEGWKVFKTDLPPGAGGVITYFAIVDPVIKGNDYNMRTILTEAFGVAETNTIYKTLADSVAGQQLVAMTLTLNMK